MINSYTKLITDLDPGDEPVTLDEANKQSRLTVAGESGIEDDYVLSLIPAARHAIEGKIMRPIGEQVFELGLGQWPFGCYGWDWASSWAGTNGFAYRDLVRSAAPYGVYMEMPRPPLIGIDTIKYTKDDGTEVTWYDSTASPIVDPGVLVIETGSEPGAIFLTSGGSWPTDLLQSGYPIKIRFRAGITNINADLKQAILFTVAHFFENREPVMTGLRAAAVDIPMAASWLIEPYCNQDFR